MITKEIKCDVYLEGIQVEFNTINLTEQIGSPPVATVTFPPDLMALAVMPKTVCHIFYWDEGEYKLIFQGELIGYGNHYSESYRESKLQFAGFTHNWRTTPVLPLDISLQNIMNHCAYLVNYPIGSGVGYTSFEFVGKDSQLPYGPLQVLAEKMTTASKAGGTADTSLVTALNVMIKDGFTDKSVYLKAMSEAFNIFNGNQIKIFESDVMKGLLKNIAVTQYLAQNIMTFDGPTPIHEALTDILRYLGYCYHEVATPSVAGGKDDSGIKRIFIMPEPYYFTPPNCNIIFDDEINQLLFDRNIENEPTRVVNEITPFQGIGKTEDGSVGFMNTIVTTVLPQGVMIPGLMSEATKNGPVQALKVLGLTEEEQCRGILLSRHRDITGIESAYIVHALDGSFPEDKKLVTADDYVTATMDLGVKNSTTKLKEAYDRLRGTDDKDGKRSQIHYYHVGMGMTAFNDDRLSRRTATLTVPYNPYRLPGFPAIIMTKYLQILTGTISSSSVVISANGQAAQTLSLTHIRAIPLNFSPKDLKKLQEANVISKSAAAIFSKDASNTFFDDDVKPPFIYHDFYDMLKNNTFYPNIIGETKSEPKFKNVTTKGLTEAASNLFLEYFLNNASKKDEFRRNITWRPIATKKDVEKHWISGTRSLENKTVVEIASKPFVTQRQERVKEAFYEAGKLLEGKKIFSEKK